MQTQPPARRLFVTATLAHLIVSLALSVVLQSHPDLSRDSIKYGITGQRLAERFSEGDFQWSMWVDHGWYQLIGWTFYLLGPYLLVVQAINAAAMGAAAVLTYRIGLKVFRVEPAARVAAYTAAFFPSALYYTSLPIKEACSIFAVCGIIWGVLLSQKQESVARGIRWLAVGLLIIAALRVYLVFVYLGCIALSLAPLRTKNAIHAVLVFVTWGVLVGLTLFAIAFTFQVDLKEYEHLKYFDLDYVNRVRVDMATGTGKIYTDDQEAVFGHRLDQDITNAAKGVFFFFMSIDLFNIRRGRQIAAIPEMLFILYCIPSLFAGIRDGWHWFPRRLLPLLIFTIALVAVYGGAATNMGAMYRWRLQALPFVLLLVFYGATVRRKGYLFKLVCRFAPRSRQTRGSRPDLR